MLFSPGLLGSCAGIGVNTWSEPLTDLALGIIAYLIGGSITLPQLRRMGRRILGSAMGEALGATLVVMLVIFLLGFILDFIEITFVVVPIVGPVLLAMGIDPVWLGIMIAINLQTSFLTPPFGFALFYLRGVAPESIRTLHIYKGVIPFIIIQLIGLLLIVLFPGLVTYLIG